MSYKIISDPQKNPYFDTTKPFAVFYKNSEVERFRLDTGIHLLLDRLPFRYEAFGKKGWKNTYTRRYEHIEGVRLRNMRLRAEWTRYDIKNNTVHAQAYNGGFNPRMVAGYCLNSTLASPVTVPPLAADTPLGQDYLDFENGPGYVGYMAEWLYRENLVGAAIYAISHWYPPSGPKGSWKKEVKRKLEFNIPLDLSVYEEANSCLATLPPNLLNTIQMRYPALELFASGITPPFSPKQGELIRLARAPDLPREFKNSLMSDFLYAGMLMLHRYGVEEESILTDDKVYEGTLGSRGLKEGRGLTYWGDSVYLGTEGFSHRKPENYARFGKINVREALEILEPHISPDPLTVVFYDENGKLQAHSLRVAKFLCEEFLRKSSPIGSDIEISGSSIPRPYSVNEPAICSRHNFGHPPARLSYAWNKNKPVPGPYDGGTMKMAMHPEYALTA